MKDKIVVIKFPIREYDLDELVNQFKSVHKYIKEEGYDWDMIIIPRDCDWTELTPHELKNIRDMIDRVLEDKHDDSDNEAGRGAQISGSEI